MEVDISRNSSDGGTCSSIGIRQRFEAVKSKIISAGGKLENIDIIAVVKGRKFYEITDLIKLPVKGLADNYANDLIDKARYIENFTKLPGKDFNRSFDTANFCTIADVPEVDSEIGIGQNLKPQWHFIGAIQRRKVKQLAPYVSLWQSVDRLDEAKSIAAFSSGAKILLEVNAYDLVSYFCRRTKKEISEMKTRESDIFFKQLSVDLKGGRGGVLVAELDRLIDDIDNLGLKLEGLMTIAPLGGYDVTKASFDMLSHLTGKFGLPTCSMGMSSDFEIAIGSGSTMLRLGKVLFSET